MVDGERMYRIRWKGFTEQDDTWEPLSHFSKLSLVRNFHKTHKLPFSSRMAVKRPDFLDSIAENHLVSGVIAMFVRLRIDRKILGHDVLACTTAAPICVANRVNTKHTRSWLLTSLAVNVRAV